MSGVHVAIIMDGNGRWAQAQGRPRLEGHRAGADTVRRMVEAAPRMGVTTLTLYAFSSDNWKRPAAEVNGLLRLLDRYLREETERLRKEGVRIDFIGRRDRLPAALRERIEASEHSTRHARRLRLRIALDYSGREAIRRGEIGPDVDLLIRTGGEQRLSDFLLWEAAYAELWFTRRAWPEFTAEDLGNALADFHSRERRFGQVPAA